MQGGGGSEGGPASLRFYRVSQERMLPPERDLSTGLPVEAGRGGGGAGGGVGVSVLGRTGVEVFRRTEEVHRSPPRVSEARRKRSSDALEAMLFGAPLARTRRAGGEVEGLSSLSASPSPDEWLGEAPSHDGSLALSVVGEPGGSPGLAPMSLSGRVLRMPSVRRQVAPLARAEEKVVTPLATTLGASASAPALPRSFLSALPGPAAPPMVHAGLQPDRSARMGTPTWAGDHAVAQAPPPAAARPTSTHAASFGGHSAQSARAMLFHAPAGAQAPPGVSDGAAFVRASSARASPRSLAGATAAVARAAAPRRPPAPSAVEEEEDEGKEGGDSPLRVGAGAGGGGSVEGEGRGGAGAGRRRKERARVDEAVATAFTESQEREEHLKREVVRLRRGLEAAERKVHAAKVGQSKAERSRSSAHTSAASVEERLRALEAENRALRVELGTWRESTRVQAAHKSRLLRAVRILGGYLSCVPGALDAERALKFVRSSGAPAPPGFSISAETLRSEQDLLLSAGATLPPGLPALREESRVSAAEAMASAGVAVPSAVTDHVSASGSLPPANPGDAATFREACAVLALENAAWADRLLRVIRDAERARAEQAQATARADMLARALKSKSEALSRAERILSGVQNQRHAALEAWARVANAAGVEAMIDEADRLRAERDAPLTDPILASLAGEDPTALPLLAARLTAPVRNFAFHVGNARAALLARAAGDLQGRFPGLLDAPTAAHLVDGVVQALLQPIESLEHEKLLASAVEALDLELDVRAHSVAALQPSTPEPLLSRADSEGAAWKGASSTWVRGSTTMMEGGAGRGGAGGGAATTATTGTTGSSTGMEGSRVGSARTRRRSWVEMEASDAVERAVRESEAADGGLALVSLAAAMSAEHVGVATQVAAFREVVQREVAAAAPALQMELLLKLRRIMAAAIEAGAGASLTDVVQTVVAEVCVIVAAERGALFLFDAERDELWTPALGHSAATPSSPAGGGAATPSPSSPAASATSPAAPVTVRFPASRGIAGWVAQHRRPSLVPDAYADPRFNTAVDAKSGFKTRNILAVPVMEPGGGRLLAVLQAVNKRGSSPFAAMDAFLLGLLASTTALVLTPLRDDAQRASAARNEFRLIRALPAVALPFEPLASALPLPCAVPPALLLRCALQSWAEHVEDAIARVLLSPAVRLFVVDDHHGRHGDDGLPANVHDPGDDALTNPVPPSSDHDDDRDGVHGQGWGDGGPDGDADGLADPPILLQDPPSPSAARRAAAAPGSSATAAAAAAGASVVTEAHWHHGSLWWSDRAANRRNASVSFLAGLPSDLAADAEHVEEQFRASDVWMHLLPKGVVRTTPNHAATSLAGRTAGRSDGGAQVLPSAVSSRFYRPGVDVAHPTPLILIPCKGPSGAVRGVLQVALANPTPDVLAHLDVVAGHLGSALCYVDVLRSANALQLAPTPAALVAAAARAASPALSTASRH